MRRHILCTSVLLLGASLLAGCGQKGPLVLPPTKPVMTQPAAATSAARPAAATSTAHAADASDGD